MNIKIILIDENVQNFYMNCIDEYKKRLSKYCKINFIFCKNENNVDVKSLASDYKISISNIGHTISSEELAKKINFYQVNRISNIAILINSENIRCDEKLAITNVDMDTGLTTTIIFEQIYRAYKILFNENYHK